MPKIEEIIEKEGFIISSVKGTSMLPLLDESKDLFKATKVNKELNVDDMVLYRSNNKVVLHRILKVYDEYYLISGDNTKYIENIAKKDVFGVVVSYFKYGREVKLDSEEYLNYLNNLERDVSKRKIIIKEKSVNKTSLDLISLVRDVIFNTSNTNKIIDYKELYKLAKKQKLIGFIFTKIDKKYCPPEVYEKFKKYYGSVIKRKIVFDSEKKQIIDEFEKRAIEYLPFKGDDFNRLYPKGAVREFSDVDIIIKEKNKVKKIMLDFGYVQKVKAVDNQYYKGFCLFEMHNRLFDDIYDKSGYFKDPFKLATKSKDSNYAYCLGNEVYYAYLINHFYKHYITYGIGLRYFIDLYYFKQNVSLDEKVVDDLLMRLGIKEFHDEWMRFSNDLLYKKINELDGEKVNFIFSGSVYGNRANRVERLISKKGKFGYILNRIIPPYSWMRLCYPWLNKVPFLYPFSILLRAISILLSKKRRQLAFNESKVYNEVKNNIKI